MSPGPLLHDPETVRDTARRIVSGPPYREGEPGAIRQAFEQLLDLLGEAVARLFGAVGGAPPVAWAIAVLGLAVLALVVWRATRGATLGRGDTAAVPERATDRSAEQWWQQSQRHRGSGDLEAALRAGYVATVVRLIERGVLEDVPGRTIRELDGVLPAAAPTVAPAVREAGVSVEQVVFGDRAVRDGDLAAVDAAWSLVDRRAGRVTVTP